MNAVILKMGGSVLAKLPDSFYKMVAGLKESGICEPVIVHGGGPEINQTLEKFGVKSSFVDGLRVTTDEVLDVAEMVMSGSINKNITIKLQKAGVLACGISGVDCSLLKAEPVDPKGSLGHVGQVTDVNKDWLKLIIDNGGIPVISPIGMDASGQRYNINGDMAAAAIAESLKGKLIFISDVPGVISTFNGKKTVLTKLTKQQIEEMIASGTIYGGMIPKVRSAINALDGGVQESVILNGLIPTDLEDYIEGKEVGSKVIMEEVHHV
ncbi:acetylglutamate kinase [Virgibacillus profundi]|uniref:Acetylglutamate kinase n=2 Tax=Virgibacillus profundi TaxID=2024555 RepID=A0A2A2IF61_9BACI|nr:acetylglutamate kinase [Virgibacillus profundi]PAV29790.1 acetylglutamate kinase [Virgibacillus profundi]PXY53962.1 acetylglutamate kinase [Virgibacillus profundi]